MDLTKNIIDFNLKVERGEMELPDGKCMAPNEYNMFASQHFGNEKQTPLAPPLENPSVASENEQMKMPTDRVQKPTTPQLIENVGKDSATKAVISGDISPPPRPLTSSEVVGFSTAIDDPEMQLDDTVALNKSRSLPASPNNLNSAHLTDLFGFAAVKAIEPPKFGAPTTMETTPSMILPGITTNVTPKGLTTKGLPVKRPTEASAARNNQQFCLRWNNYQSNLTNVFDELLQNESFVDVTLACDGQSIKAHKMILSACSPYFQALFYDNPCQHPIIIMRDVRWQELKALIEFMYKGEINVSQDQINPLLKVAEMLKIRGLAEVSSTGSGGGGGPQLFPDHRPIFEEDDVDDDEDDDMDDDRLDFVSPIAKRPRIQVSQTFNTPLNMNMAEQRMRKGSREGPFMEDGRLTPAAPPSVSRPQPPLPKSKGDMEPTAANPVAMTTSTIVRNPFASPNPSGSQTSAANSSGGPALPTASSSNSISATSQSSSVASNNSIALPYRPLERNSSPQVRAPSGPTTTSSLPSPATNASAPPPISIHPHPAAAAVAAAALANPHHPHHHAAAAAQQLAAQHQQLQVAAHSHAMASALGASLAAAAAGNTPASNPAGATSSHHDDMEIKPEIAEMIREEERVSQLNNCFILFP